MTQELTQTLLRNKKPLLWGLALAAVVALFLGGSFISLVHNKIEKDKLTRKTKQLDVQYEQLLQKKEKLEAQDPQLLEEIARTQYHLAKPEEIEFRFEEKKIICK